MQYDLDWVRQQFPSLAITDQGRRRIYLDNPAGTQVPQAVAQSMTRCLIEANANLGGYFASSKNADAVVDNAHSAVADLLNADMDEVIFGQNMTTLTFHVSRSIARLIKPGDEILLSRMDHDANVQPWVLMARDCGATVRWLEFDTDLFEFDMQAVAQQFNQNTRLVCVGGASNLLGTLNDVKTICTMAKEVGAWSYIDAVQSVPHVSTDVKSIDCDFLACSAYKYFGPHQGSLYIRREVLEALEPYKVRPASAQSPGCLETGTQSHEGMAGTAAAIDYLSDIGKRYGSSYEIRYPDFSGRRLHVHTGMDTLFDYEANLSARLVNGLVSIPGITVQGISAPKRMHRRVPTVSFTSTNKSPDEIAEQLAKLGIFVWSGHNYAVEVANKLELNAGGVVRVGPVHYNSADEIDEVLEAIETLNRVA